MQRVSLPSHGTQSKNQNDQQSPSGQVIPFQYPTPVSGQPPVVSSESHAGQSSQAQQGRAQSTQQVNLVPHGPLVPQYLQGPRPAPQMPIQFPTYNNYTTQNYGHASGSFSLPVMAPIYYDTTQPLPVQLYQQQHYDQGYHQHAEQGSATAPGSVSGPSVYTVHDDQPFPGSLDFRYGGSSGYHPRSQTYPHDSLPRPKTHSSTSSSSLLGMTPATALRNRCNICQKQFKRPSSLQTHLYSHTGEKPFACDWIGCGRLFSVRSNMIRHRKLHERDRKTKDEQTEEDEKSDQEKPQTSTLNSSGPAAFLNGW
jgi:hypothetical protein